MVCAKVRPIIVAAGALLTGRVDKFALFSPMFRSTKAKISTPW
jgi:hypothetical protein